MLQGDAGAGRQKMCCGVMRGEEVLGIGAERKSKSDAQNKAYYEGVSRNRRNLYENVMMRLFSLRNYDVPSLT